MPAMVQIRNVPDSLHRQLKSRAALAGMSLSDYLLAEIGQSAERPTLAEIRARLEDRTAVTPHRGAGADHTERARPSVIVVDASALLESLLPMPAANRVDQRMLDPSETLHAPHLIDIEVAPVIRWYGAHDEINAERARPALTDLADFPLRRYSHDWLLTGICALRNSLTAYDAAYVALAEALDAPLLTRDQRLAASHGHQARIELV